MNRKLIAALREEAEHVALPADGLPLAEYIDDGVHAGTGIMFWAQSPREGLVNGSVWIVYPDRGTVTLHYFTSREADHVRSDPNFSDEQGEYRAEFGLELPEGEYDAIRYFGVLFDDAVRYAKFGT